MGKKIGVPYEGFAEYAREVAAQGAVLIQNTDGVLPLQPQERVSVFGRCQIDYYRSGTGSGGAVNVPYTTNLIDGLRDSKAVLINEELAAVYEAWLIEHPFDNGGGGWAAEPWNQQEMELTEELTGAAAEVSDKAIIVIGRTAGEDKDNADSEGSYRLTALELDMIKKVTAQFANTIVLLNVPDIIDMSWVNEAYVHPIKAILYAWHGGMEGGNAIADVLTGKVTPSGKLTETIAVDMDAYPSTKNYGSKTRNIYQEDIYVGYRYFETFAPKQVVYEFGYGISYTTFSVAAGEGTVSLQDKILTIPVKVKNTGDTYSGKEVVQLYVSAPQGSLGKPTRVLAAYQKTRELAPQEEQTMTLSVDLNSLASYDDSGITGHKSCYVLEAGDYYFYVGNSIRNTNPVTIDGAAAYTLDELSVVEKLSEALAPELSFEIMKPGEKKEDGTYELTYTEVSTKTVDMRQRIEQNLPKNYDITGDMGIKLQNVAAGEKTLEEFVAQLSMEQLAMLIRGEGMCHPMVTAGTASAFGSVSRELHEYGIPLACCADGPSGIRMEGGRLATQVPIGTLLASTWDPKLIESLYVYEGKELLRNEVDALLGPGMNLRRNPMNGRNFEYFSEDPLLTGEMAAAIVRGIQTGGSNATLKHFACNSQETARFFVDAAISERAARELYLRGFEIAVKTSGANAIMTSYNPINGHWAASNYDLVTTILRGEWGFDGIVMTDWWAQMNDVVLGGEPSRSMTSAMVHAQNDLYMVIRNSGAKVNALGDDTVSAIQNGTLAIGELQRNVGNILRFLMQAPVFRRNPAYGGEPVVLHSMDVSSQPSCVLEQMTTFDFEKEPQYCLEVKNKGSYLSKVLIRSDENFLAQSTTNILANNQILGTVQLGGTGGQWYELELGRLELENGYYELRLEELSPGLTVGVLTLECESEK